MLKFLSLKCDPISQPAANDLVERRTWCSLRVKAGSRFASRLWDKTLEEEREALDVPAFPLAEWIIQNWWSLLNELCPWESVPRNPIIDAEWLSWTRRHCLRSADSSLFLPKIFLYNDGRDLRTEWHADLPGSMPNMPGEFVSDGVEQLDPQATEASLALFVNHTLGRVKDLPDDRVNQVAAQWRVIQNSDVEERDFCILAGRMGVDPYHQDEMSEDLARFFEETLTSADEPLVRDLTEVARPESVVAQWLWVEGVTRDLELGPCTTTLSVELPSKKLPPPDYGYQLAREVRAAADLGFEPLRSVVDAANLAIQGIFRTEDRNHIPGQGIKAIVGQSGSGAIIAAGPRNPHPYNQRFTDARNVFHALATSSESQRLVTDAYSWDQKASRAFAAEFLAPRQALVNRLSRSTADPLTVELLSKEFQASTYVILRQLENAGVALSFD